MGAKTTLMKLSPRRSMINSTKQTNGRRAIKKVLLNGQKFIAPTEKTQAARMGAWSIA